MTDNHENLISFVAAFGFICINHESSFIQSFLLGWAVVNTKWLAGNLVYSGGTNCVSLVSSKPLCWSWLCRQWLTAVQKKKKDKKPKTILFLFGLFIFKEERIKEVIFKIWLKQGCIGVSCIGCSCSQCLLWVNYRSRIALNVAFDYELMQSSVPVPLRSLWCVLGCQ